MRAKMRRLLKPLVVGVALSIAVAGGTGSAGECDGADGYTWSTPDGWEIG
jgi:hypothetical protein